MKTAFIRADASFAIGTGHVMRCLVLADALRGRGFDVHFLCRNHSGHFGDHIAERSFAVHMLPPGGEGYADRPDAPPHAAWLDATPEEDAAACRAAIDAVGQIDLLVVDHYALDHRFETPLRSVSRRIVVIDDLADRRHDCDVLIDQNFGSEDPARYDGLVPEEARLLLGARYAMLRPEFAQNREISLRHRDNPRLRKIIMSFGGVDSDNITAAALDGINKSKIATHLEVDIVLGKNSQHIDYVMNFASGLKYNTKIYVNTGFISTIMSSSDLSIGAVGTTVLERFCLGLPSIIIPIAENQIANSRLLSSRQVAICLNNDENMPAKLARSIDTLSTSELARLSRVTQEICDGAGTSRVLNCLLGPID